MSRPRYDWWPYVKGMIRRYPGLCEKYQEYIQQKITPNYEAEPVKQGHENRKTEDTVMKGISKTAIREYHAVHDAMTKTTAKADGAEILTMIELVYWKRTHTIEGAAQVIHVSYRTACEWHRLFVYSVAENFGLMD